MEDYIDLPVLEPQKALAVISDSTLSKAQRLLAASLITQSRSFLHHNIHDGEDFLVLDVSHFLTHRINTKLIAAIGEEFAGKISAADPDIILTAPSSGNIPSITTALCMSGQPDVIYAPKGTPITVTDVYRAQNLSYTHGHIVELTVAKDCLPQDTRVAICDDFLDTGRTALDLVSIVTKADASPVAFFFVIEKPFGGREAIKKQGFAEEQIYSLIRIDSMRPGKLKLKGIEYWLELVRK